MSVPAPINHGFNEAKKLLKQEISNHPEISDKISNQEIEEMLSAQRMISPERFTLFENKIKSLSSELQNRLMEIIGPLRRWIDWEDDMKPEPGITKLDYFFMTLIYFVIIPLYALVVISIALHQLGIMEVGIAEKFPIIILLMWLLPAIVMLWANSIKMGE